MKYTPDRWIILEITTPEEVLYKVFAMWYGGYCNGDSWKVNSGITDCSFDGECYTFEGYSGSTYVCHNDCYGLSAYGAGVVCTWQEALKDATIEVLEEGVVLELFGKEKL